MPIAIKVKNLQKSFISETNNSQKIKALDGVNIEIVKGEVLGILGPNGAGKTTFLNTLSTLLIPDAGTIEIFGEPLIPKNFRHLRSLLNMSSGNPNFPWSLTVEENLKFYGRLYGLRGKTLQARVTKSIELLGLNERAKQRFDELSSGTKQKLSLAKCLLNNPQIIFLDEPTIGLDPEAAVNTRSIISRIHEELNVTILLTTHNMPEAELMCQRIAFIRQGKILKVASPKDLKTAQGKATLEEVFISLAHEKLGAPQIAQEKIEMTSGQGAPIETPVIFPKINFFEGAVNWLNRSYAFTCRNFLFSARNFFAFVELVFWPVVSLVSIGLMGDYLKLGAQALSFIMTGAITAGILQVAQLDVAYSLLYEVWSKSVKHTFLTPVGISEHLFGSWMIGILRGSIIFGILGASAIFLFGFRFPSLDVTLIFLLGIFSCALLLGLLVSVLILVFGQKAEITAWMFAYLFMLVCGIYYPIDTLPRVFYVLAQFVPITYFLEYFRQSFGFTPLLEHGLLKGFGLVIIYLILGLQMMNFAFYKARKNGIIVKLSE